MQRQISHHVRTGEAYYSDDEVASVVTGPTFS